MLNKSIIDANKSVVKFFREYLPELGYDFIENGGKKVLLAYYYDYSFYRYTPTQIRLYRRPRGDKLLSHWADRTGTFHPRIIVRLELGEPPKEINLIE
jgi:hypothetical protein